MRVERELLRGVTVVSVAESIEIDAGGAEAFRDAVLAATDGADRVVLDLKGVEFFDSAGMGVLLRVHKQLEEHGTQLALAGLNRAVQEIFQMVGFDVVFRTYRDSSDAVDALVEKDVDSSAPDPRDRHGSAT